jgi:hypothetical protein
MHAIIVECHTEPGGAHGLEGYQRGDRYVAVIDQGYDRGGNFYKEIKVYPVAGQDYYESCTVTTLNKYFKEVL